MKTCFRQILLSTGVMVALLTASAEGTTNIENLPYTITESGSYSISHDFDLTEVTTGAAITVTADNVEIDLGNHVLTLSETIVGISASEVANLKIHNGTITSPFKSVHMQESIALDLKDITQGSFENLILQKTNTGVRLSNCVDQYFVSCFFDRHFGSVIGGSFKRLRFEGCEFGEPLPIMPALSFLSEGEDLNIHNCRISTRFDGIVLAPYTGRQITNVEISDCQLVMEPNLHDIPFAGITLGYTSETHGGPIVNAKIRNCVFTNQERAIESQNCLDVHVEDCLLLPQNSLINFTKKTFPGNPGDSSGGFRIW